MATVRSLLPYLWPQGDKGARVRVVVAMGLLLLAKLATVAVPVVYGRIVDALAPKDATALLAIPTALVIGYGLLRVGVRRAA
jgi:ATP-binding cassette, subfamily B, heavy metal transporter